VVEEILVNPNLTEDMIKTGEELIKKLDKANFSVRIACWFLSELRTWKLIIVTPEVNNIGPKKSYKKIQHILQKTSEEVRISLNDISIFSPDDPLAMNMKGVISTPPKAIAGIRCTNCVFNNIRIEDSYFYRVAV
jgi:hypothetical protein